MTRTRGFVVAVLVTLASVAPAGAHEPVPDGVPSFNESEGCDALSGIRGPLADEPGLLELSEPIYGPWADFYGRTVGDAWNQRVLFTYPTMSGTKSFWVHERVWPALEMVLDALQQAATEGNTYTVRATDSFSWARFTIPPTRAFSFHAVGAALDINSTTNPYRADNVLITDMPEWFVDIWRQAGWCWGGDWVSIKDTMHYSWRGPLFTPGYVMPPPQPPLVAAAAFTAAVNLDVVLPASDPARRLFVADIDRDGAPDVVAVTPVSGGGVAVTAAPARNDFHWEEAWGETADIPADTGAPAGLADLTHDGRPDLVYLLPGPLDRVLLEIHAHGGGGDLMRSTVLTAIPHDPAARYLFEDYDRNGDTDLFVLRPGDPTTLEVWSGSGFTEMALTAAVAVGDDDRLMMGDRNVDGIPDLYSLAGDGTLRVFLGSTGYTTTASLATGIDPTGLEVASGDLDGDGHTDLFLVSPDGSAQLRRGGASNHDPGVWYRLRTHRVTRLAGADRYATAAAVSQHSQPNGAATVFVAVGNNFPDALAGAAVAGAMGAPLLLLDKHSIPATTSAELLRLDPGLIVILGGTAAISPEVEAALDFYAPTVRLAGANRYETAIAISQFGFPDDGSAAEVVVATGTGYADALAGGPAAAALGGPLLLTGTDALPPGVRDEVIRLGPERIVVLGGTNAISAEVMAELETLAPTIRVSGADRYQTATAVSALVFPDGAPSVYVATGTAFPDGLAGGAAAGAAGAPLLLTPPTALPNGVGAEIVRLGTYDIRLLGGTSAIAAGVATALEILGM